jgi:predicted flap endonuclease-1-like 5' DNA nuclease
MSKHKQVEPKQETSEATHREPTPSEIELAEQRLREGEARIRAARATMATPTVVKDRPELKPETEALTGEERARRNDQKIREAKKELGTERAETSFVPPVGPASSPQEALAGINAQYDAKLKRLGITEADLKAARESNERDAFDTRYEMLRPRRA